MGINITSSKEVQYDASHQELLDTSLSANPSVKIVKGLRVQSIFRRRKHKGHKNDGSPFMHALKGKYNYSISMHELFKFRTEFYQILDKSLKGASYDVVISLPSSGSVNEFLAKRVARKCGARLELSYFSKKTVQEVIIELSALNGLSNSMERQRKHVLNRLAKVSPHRDFAIKDIQSIPFRRYIDPLKQPVGANLSNLNVLLIDDLLASGSSMTSAKELVLANSPPKSIEAMSLCSAL